MPEPLEIPKTRQYNSNIGQKSGKRTRHQPLFGSKSMNERNQFVEVSREYVVADTVTEENLSLYTSMDV